MRTMTCNNNNSKMIPRFFDCKLALVTFRERISRSLAVRFSSVKPSTALLIIARMRASCGSHANDLHMRLLLYTSLLPIISFGLVGCNELGLRRGPAPVLDATAVQTAASNQETIIQALADDAGVHGNPTDYYYRVAEAGFNFVDDQCQAYFDTIFFIDRERSQIKSGLAAAGATTAAILGVTNASTLSMSVVASAFGFASATTDIVAGTYLYSLPPSTTQKSR